MGLQQSKDELLYQQVTNANIEAVKKLRAEGAGLEWTDKEGKTPLILASTNPQLFDVAKTLTELGANVNAYRTGHHAGTPLHHAARSGLVQMVHLLLSHGANALVMNDDCQTALDVARLKGNSNVVRAIESHICLFSGWLHEVHEPGFLELRTPKPRKVWVVIVPCGARKQSKPLQLELSLYSGLQDGKPSTIMRLWKANMDESNLNQPNPTVIISSSKIPKRWRRKRGIGHSQVKQSRIKLAPVNENEKPQFKQFCNACKGISQVMHPALPFNNQVSSIEPPAQTTRDPELPLPINASLQSGSEVGPTAPISYYPNSETSIYSQIVPTAPVIISAPPSVPSAPLIPETVDDGPVHYPTIDSNPGDGEKEINNNDSSSCVICLDSPVEGACIPCGHMAGCMICLNEIKGKDWGCPVCRTKIEQVVRLYAV
ncbi:putative E3 ubiquitin-protein ligase XBAT35 [Bidens hawaiensis]|uniref:putative E3 ubiquitin-protein ligase XBAT35 n=1 Tax=Bidens hawaiensis TaxID=980011 RepID=UPI00404B32FE